MRTRVGVYTSVLVFKDCDLDACRSLHACVGVGLEDAHKGLGCTWKVILLFLFCLRYSSTQQKISYSSSLYFKLLAKAI